MIDKETVRLKFTITGEYEATPRDYVDDPDDDVTPEGMAAIDQQNANDGGALEVVLWAEDGTIKIVVEPA